MQLFESIKLENMLRSWSDIIHTKMTHNQLINTVHGALRTYDLGDLISSIGSDKISVLNSLDANEKPL